jgi:hypothetical protein
VVQLPEPATAIAVEKINIELPNRTPCHANAKKPHPEIKGLHQVLPPATYVHERQNY